MRRGLALALLLAASPAQAALRSPWESWPAAGPAMRQPCPAAPALPREITAQDYYSDPARSVIDPARRRAYAAAVAPWNRAASQIARFADRARRGDRTAAGCAVASLAQFASRQAMTAAMATNQASYVQGWMLGAFALDWLKLRADPSIPAAERAAIPAWLVRVAERTRGYFDPRAQKVDGRNNHRAWAGLAVMAAGIAADRRDLFEWGVASFHILARQVAADGTLPLEMARRSRALHYHVFAAEPMVAMAALAAPDRVDLYEADDAALRRLMVAVRRGLADPGWFAARAGAPQMPLAHDLHGLRWAAPYLARNPDPAFARLVARASTAGDLYLGGLPP